MAVSVAGAKKKGRCRSRALFANSMGYPLTGGFDWFFLLGFFFFFPFFSFEFVANDFEDGYFGAIADAVARSDDAPVRSSGLDTLIRQSQT